MFPFRHSSIFKSRWIALLWAAGILWWAIDVAGKPHAKPAGQQTVQSPDQDAARTKQAAEILRKFTG
ncbi:MAG TPA: hypothetical protein VNZ43_00350 [Sphingomonadaceae bacterium]|jgi:hypothetical protein|nr:hypothetical protein [Sphingomonadaceae bacterium]